ncbi:hypothetical protein TVAG_329370 [Trichomonas vaginalis G3]|uniref:Protein kinase domain-containing protein n=1 Tax=Trichomonas vaginalis (strain ATCC PRA-98 / G3) TaxID=412133 RepID=A2EBA5_TRIV3|nr:protein kinase-like (PK-like) family [Trichomonas vaginalis G3]EAY10050.1 hypothetical protein TVAG_329370 [Trichomonas vaginalis G3]KAI5528500.1 protein kinase-like (PK-like) family [Trichomonas vaginalis G3]|eukprot:XP_001322273.1 hypothetical protein [Trichomonas vaginalis G3]
MIQIPEISISLKNYGYELLEPIGEGGFSSVFKVQDIRYNQLFVCKITKISHDKDSSINCNAQAQQYVNEVENLKLIWHPNVI